MSVLDDIQAAIDFFKHPRPREPILVSPATMRTLQEHDTETCRCGVCLFYGFDYRLQRRTPE